MLGSHLLVLISILALVGCKNGENANIAMTQPIADDGGSAGEGGLGNGDDVAPNPIPNPGNNNPPVQPIDPNQPAPGDLVEISEPVPDATYNPQGSPISFERNQMLEPGADKIRPVVQLAQYPDSFTSQSNHVVRLWATDDVGGSGLQEIRCQIDGGTYQACDPAVSLQGLSEGMHTIRAQAIDWDENESTEVYYNFYIDQTAPSVEFTQVPGSTTTSNMATISYAAQDDGSGVSRYLCGSNPNPTAPCGQTLQYSNLPEGPHTVYVRAVDHVGNASEQISYTWVADYTAPMIQINQQPSNPMYTNTPAIINFTVVDTLGPAGVTVVCYFNSMIFPCGSDINVSVPVNNPAEYVFQIVATDSAGNSSSAQINWSAVNISEPRSTTTVVSEDRPVDILFVIDNSGSMETERANLAERIDGMINNIQDLDWQIAMITTDSSSGLPYSDGRFLDLANMSGSYILDSTMDVNFAQETFGRTIQNVPAGAGWEQGMYSVKNAIDLYVNGSPEHRSFFRDGAGFSVVVLSDEDEGGNEHSPQITPNQLLSHVDQSFAGQKSMVFHSIITRPGDFTCLNGLGAQYGDLYAELSRLTGNGQLGGAIIGSVCEDNYASQLADIGQSVKDLQNSIELDCAPFDTDNDGEPNVTVSYRPQGSQVYQQYNGARVFQNNRVIFEDLLPIGDYKVDYHCRIN